MFVQAFQKAYRVLVPVLSQKNRAITIPTASNMKVSLSQIIPTEEYNADSTKRNVRLVYYVLKDNNAVSAEYAHDSINLLNSQEMAKTLQYEVVQIGEMEKNQSNNVVTDQRLWIIGAVLGPVAFLLLIFWLIGFIYYRCINPRRANDPNATKVKIESLNVFILKSYIIKYSFNCFSQL